MNLLGLIEDGVKDFHENQEESTDGECYEANGDLDQEFVEFDLFCRHPSSFS